MRVKSAKMVMHQMFVWVQLTQVGSIDPIGVQWDSGAPTAQTSYRPGRSSNSFTSHLLSRLSSLGAQWDISGLHKIFGDSASRRAGLLSHLQWGVGGVITFQSTCYVIGSSPALAHMHTHTHTGCYWYVIGSSLALVRARWMLRYRIFSCLAQKHTLDATL